MKMTKSLMPFLLILLISFLTSCADFLDPPPYSDPKKGPVAYIKFIAYSPYPQKAVYFFKNSQNCSGEEDSTSQIENNNSLLKIPANRDFTFYLGFADSINFCRFTISFKPLPKTTYAVLYKLGTSDCRLTIGKVSNGQLTLIQARKRIPRIPWGTTGNFCEPESTDSK